MQHNPVRYNPEKGAQLIKDLGKLTDPLALASWIGKKTRDGDQPGPEAWTYTRGYFADYGHPEHAGQVLLLFATVGVRDEVDAGLWLAEHMDQIP